MLPINAVVDPLLYSLSTKLHKKVTLRKLAHAIYRDFFSKTNIENFIGKNVDIFYIFVQNIDCGYTLKPPNRSGSNEYP